MLRKIRGLKDEEIIPKGPEGAKEVIKSLKAGLRLGIMVDQKMNDGIKVPFFNKPAMTSDALAQLCLKIKTLVITVEVERLKKTTFKNISIKNIKLV